MKEYRGNAAEQTVTVVEENESSRPLERLHTVLMKRGGGLHAWGYGGGGPTDLAFDLLWNVSLDQNVAQTHKQPFRDEWIATLPQNKDFVLTAESIENWLRDRGWDPR